MHCPTLQQPQLLLLRIPTVQDVFWRQDDPLQVLGQFSQCLRLKPLQMLALPHNSDIILLFESGLEVWGQLVKH